MASSLKEKTITGVVWSAIHKFGSTILSFVSSIVLARLLTPEDYGCIGMLAIFLAVANTFIDGGFGSALIQKQRPTREDYSTIFFWNFGLSICIYTILFFSAPIIARFYKLPILSSVLRVQGVVLVINAARIVQSNQLRKKLQFKIIAIINLSSSIVALAVTIFLAWKGFGVWALVAQQIMVSALSTSLYWIFGHWAPALTFSKESFKQLFNFGGFILLSNLVNTFSNNIQGLLIGKFYTPATMGYYSKARNTELLSSTFISSVIDQVSYPVLSEAQNDKAYMIRMLRKFTSVLAFITFPIMSVLALIAKPVFVFLYSDRWLESAPYFQLLCIGGIAICLQGINYYAVAALGRSKDMFNWTLVKRFAGMTLIVAGMAAFGIYGLLTGSVISAWLIYIINASLVSKYLGYTVWTQFKDILPIIVLSFLSFAAGYAMHWLPISGMYMMGIIQFIVFFCVYIAASYFGKVSALHDTIDTLTVLLKRVKVIKK